MVVGNVHSREQVPHREDDPLHRDIRSGHPAQDVVHAYRQYLQPMKAGRDLRGVLGGFRGQRMEAEDRLRPNEAVDAVDAPQRESDRGPLVGAPVRLEDLAVLVLERGQGLLELGRPLRRII